MAAEVSRHAARPVSRQTITQLEEAGNRKPHYIVALAKVMGASTDLLLTGTAVKQPPAPEAVPTLSTPSLESTLESLSVHLMDMGATTRHRVGYLLADLADRPEDHAQIAAMLKAAAAPTAPTYATATEDDSRRLIEWSENFKRERRVQQRRKQG